MPVTMLNAIAQSSAERLINSFFEGMLLAALVWLVLRLVPRQNAGTRFSMWMAALLSIATLPVAEALARVDRPITSAVSHAALTVPAGWGTALFVTWAAIALLLLTRVSVGVVQLVRLRNSAREVELTTIDARPRQTLVEFQQHRKTALCVSDRVSVPTAVGLFCPAVVLPAWALSDLAASDLNSVLVHELAHLRRRDDWTNLLQKVVRAVFFFHPAVWWIESRLSLEREMACDEHVLANSEDPRAYAECLVSLAERGFLHRAVMMAQGAVNRVRECSARVTQILANGRPRTARASRLALISAASGSVLMLATFAHAPNLVTFGPQTTRDAIAMAPAQQSHGIVTPAAWHPASHMAPMVTQAVFVPNRATAAMVKQSSKHASVSRHDLPAAKSAVVHRAVPVNSAPAVYRAKFTTSPQTNRMQGTFVIVRQADFYSDGTQIWAVSIYRLAVLTPQPKTQNDNPRKAI
jgi:beta-lactamase regulating signal transducer with metallopeptidase domain